MPSPELSIFLSNPLWVGGIGIILLLLFVSTGYLFVQKKRQSAPTKQLTPDDPEQNVYRPVRQQADLLTEGSIYVAYGYLDKAAQSFRQYVDEIDPKDIKTLRTLFDIYFRLKALDNCAVMLERLYLLGDDPQFIIESLKKALLIERHNPQLLQVAEHFTPKRNQEESSAISPPPATPPPAPTEKPRPDVSQPVPDQPASVTPKSPPDSIPDGGTPKQLRLISGNAPLSPLTAGEQFILRAFNPEIEARIHITTNNLDAAISALRYAIEVNPQRSATYFTNLLRIFHLQKSLDEYARYLWHLYYILGDHGSALRERFLAMGVSLGAHPIFDSLAKISEPWQLQGLGQQFGYFIRPEENYTRLNLVAEIQEERSQSNDILQEVDGYLEFGQIEEALTVLENAIHADPNAINLYPPLFDLYNRLDDLDRYTKWAATLKQLVPQLPPEITPMMTNLYRRLYQRKKKIAA